MKAVLFALNRVRLSGLSDETPCGLLPLVDRPFVQHVVGALAELGVSELTIATDGATGRFQAAVGDGLRWGCPTTVVAVPESDPLAPLRSRGDDSLLLVGSVDRLPLLSALPAVPTRLVAADGVSDWCVAPAAALRGLPVGARPERIAAALASSEAQVVPRALSARSFADLLAAQRTVLNGGFPAILASSQGAHVARSARVHPSARVAPSAWVGPRCRVGPDVVLGPNVCLGEGCVVERGTRLTETLVTAGTYIGVELELDGIFLDRGRLYHTRLDEALSVPDGFLLGEAAPERPFWGLRRRSA